MTSLLHYTALMAAILMTVAAQILLKIGAGSVKGSLNVITLAGLTMFGLVTVLIVFALQAISLKNVISLSALTFVAMPLAARIFLGQNLTRRGVLGSVVIVIGIIVFLAGG